MPTKHGKYLVFTSQKRTGNIISNRSQPPYIYIPTPDHDSYKYFNNDSLPRFWKGPLQKFLQNWRSDTESAGAGVGVGNGTVAGRADVDEMNPNGSGDVDGRMSSDDMEVASL